MTRPKIDRGPGFSRAEDLIIIRAARGGANDAAIKAQFFPARSISAIRQRRIRLGVLRLTGRPQKATGRPATVTRWSERENCRLFDGIQAGLSWEELFLTIPGRDPFAIRAYAIRTGLALNMKGRYPQIPDDGDAWDGSSPDVLLEKLRQVHGEARA